MNKILGYTRVSTNTQTTENQKLQILNYIHNNKLTIDKIVETTVTSRQNRKDRLIDKVLEQLNDRDTLLVYSLDRLGRSTLETLQIIDEYVGTYYSKEWIRKNILKQDEEMIAEIDKQIEAEPSEDEDFDEE